MSSTTLRVGVFPSYPMTNFNCTSLSNFRVTERCLGPGLAIEIIKLIAYQANMTIEPVFFHQNISGTELFQALENGTVDTISFAVLKTLVRKEKYSFSIPLYTGVTKMAVRRVDSAMTSMYDFFTVYSLRMWFTIFVSLLAFLVFGIFVHFTEWHLGLQKQIKIGDLIWKILRFQMNQNDKLEFRLYSGMFALWIFALLQCLIILSIYQSYIISSVLKVKDPKPFKSEDLVTQLQQGENSIVSVTRRSWIFDQTVRSNNSYFADVRKTFEYNPIVTVKSEREALEMVNKGRYVLFYNNDNLVGHMLSDYCDLVVLDSFFFPEQYRYLMFHRGYPHMDKINAAIKIQAVFIYRAYRKYIDKHEKSRCSSTSGPAPLSIAPYVGIIILFLTGTVCGLVAFGLEFLFYKCLKQ